MRPATSATAAMKVSWRLGFNYKPRTQAVRKIEFLQSLIVVALIATAAAAIAIGGRQPTSGTIVGKISDKWTGRRIWAVDSFASVVTDDGGTVTVAIGDQYSHLHPGFRYAIDFVDGRAVAAKRLSD